MLSSINEIFIIFISLKETRITAILYQHFSFLQHVLDICLARLDKLGQNQWRTCLVQLLSAFS